MFVDSRCVPVKMVVGWCLPPDDGDGTRSQLDPFEFGEQTNTRNIFCQAWCSLTNLFCVCLPNSFSMMTTSSIVSIRLSTHAATSLINLTQVQGPSSTGTSKPECTWLIEFKINCIQKQATNKQIKLFGKVHWWMGNSIWKMGFLFVWRISIDSFFFWWDFGDLLCAHTRCNHANIAPPCSGFNISVRVLPGPGWVPFFIPFWVHLLFFFSSFHVNLNKFTIHLTLSQFGGPKSRWLVDWVYIEIYDIFLPTRFNLIPFGHSCSLFFFFFSIPLGSQNLHLKFVYSNSTSLFNRMGRSFEAEWIDGMLLQWIGIGDWFVTLAWIWIFFWFRVVMITILVDQGHCISTVPVH